MSDRKAILLNLGWDTTLLDAFLRSGEVENRLDSLDTINEEIISMEHLVEGEGAILMTGVFENVQPVFVESV